MLAARMTWTHRFAGRVRGAASDRRRTPSAQGSTESSSLMLGCFERSLFPSVSRSAQRLAPELAVVAKQGCCGALHAHNGRPDTGRAMAERLGEALPDVIVTTSGGCAAHLASVLGRHRVRELSEHLADRVRGVVLVAGRPARVAVQDSCHLRNGLGVWREPRRALARIAEVIELPNAARCCGAAGTYSLLRPKDARAVLAPKLDEIEAADIDYVIAVNPGCLRQLQQGLRKRRSAVRAIHLADFLALSHPTPPSKTDVSTTQRPETATT